MFSIQKIQKIPLFENQILKKGEILFDEGEKDNYIYIIQSGSVSIEKKLSSNTNHTKILAILKAGKIFGEGSLNTLGVKQVRIRAIDGTKLLKINACTGMQNFLSKYPKEGLEFLKEIIRLGNERILKANAQITATYNINNHISKIKTITTKSIIGLIDIFQEILEADYIIFIEKNRVLDTYYQLKYDTRNKGKLSDKVLEIKDESLLYSVLKKENIGISPSSVFQKINIGNIHIGYFIIGRKKENFEENDMKIITSITSILAGVIKQKEFIEEERDKIFMRNI